MIRTRSPHRATAALAVLGLLAGCSFAGDATTDTAGIGAGAVAGGITANPFVGLAVGITARWAAGAAVAAVERELQDSIQSRIAEVAGPAPLNVSLPWRVEHTLPIGEQAGAVVAVRDFGAPLIPCREIVYSVYESDEGSKFYVGTICHPPNGGPWKWAVGEPATSRWGSLQ